MSWEELKYGPVDIHILCEAVLCLQNEEECVSFLQDILTPREIRDMMQRLSVAELLREGKGYAAISEEVSVSSATISRVNRAMS